MKLHLIALSAVAIHLFGVTGGTALPMPPQAPAAAAKLRIRVIEGEDAVNIISQKTAVAPIVEVVDENNLPVAGASVVFWIASQNAHFSGGALQTTVLTDAAGRASAAGLTPLTNGPVQIDVVASSGSETATATIKQSNVAAPAGESAEQRQRSTRGQTAGSGGLSKLAWVGIIGGGVAASAAVVSGMNKPICQFDVTGPPDLDAVAATSSTLRFTVTVSPPDCEPQDWTVTTTVPFVTLNPTAGVGSATVVASFATNPVGAPARRFSISFTSRGEGREFQGSQRQNLPPCNSQQVAGGNQPETRVIEMGRTAGTFSFIYDTQSIPDRMVVSSGGRTLFDTGCIGTNGSRMQNITYSGSSTTVSVAVTPNCLGSGSTVWSFTVTCPR